MSSGMIWTTEQEEQLIRDWTLGFSSFAIAQNMGLSKSQIENRVSKLIGLGKLNGDKVFRIGRKVRRYGPYKQPHRCPTCGRPWKRFTDDQLMQCIEWRRDGWTWRHIAALLEVEPQQIIQHCVYTFLKKHPDIKMPKRKSPSQ